MLTPGTRVPAPPPGPFQSWLEKGGLAQIGLAHSRHTLAWAQARHVPAKPASFYLWASDEGLLNAEVVQDQGLLPLERLLLVKPSAPEDVWRVGQESAETGLFEWIFLKPSRTCAVGQLRKLQLTAERTRTRVVLFVREKLPHWLCRLSWG